jgi:hypothetical protein
VDSPSVLGLLSESCAVQMRCRRKDAPVPDLSHALPVLDATVFLYPSVEDAEKGTKFGGTGVVVGVPMPGRKDLRMRYVITNWHVACGSGSSVIRVRDAKSGKHQIVDLDPSEWSFIPGGPDLAATVLKLPSDINPTFLEPEMFVDPLLPGDVFIGDDVFMVGRFIDHDGHETTSQRCALEPSA